ncbi:TPA: hypothetical protein KOC08_003878 [Clostridioides difficile]|uniref:hypothetical protein n=1 Tax=Clostridioides difficile TaxID=1496 RepID=UPI00103388A4|nr:hypothetical protein [Clostridioides difficile]MBZ0812365.1 hypothetical protein [Clostridioides difficile]MCI4781296.1 hypothetical protein [Clostridioides difficile]MDN9385495.1 hypothetical protein [Clostridioides difficile]VIB48568.1 Uncharacterised protein [Clostridioides difficile]VII01130.1 Uncharacterised protein [Clostridioides difficile]
MKKYKIKFEEKVTLEHEVIVEIPNEININDICNCIEQKCQRVYDISDYIREFNGRQIDFTEDTCGETEMLVESFRKCKE